MITWKTGAARISCLAMCLAPGWTEPSTAIRTEFLLSLCAPLDGLEGSEPDANRSANLPAGWVTGPKIRGRVADRLRDWVRPAQSGVARVDAEHSLETED